MSRSARPSRYFAVLLLTALLTGCMTDGRALNSYCPSTFFIYVSKDDHFTDLTAHQIEVHNVTREALCR